MSGSSEGRKLCFRIQSALAIRCFLRSVHSLQQQLHLAQPSNVWIVKRKWIYETILTNDSRMKMKWMAPGQLEFMKWDLRRHGINGMTRKWTPMNESVWIGECITSFNLLLPPAVHEFISFTFHKLISLATYCFILFATPFSNCVIRSINLKYNIITVSISMLRKQT